VRKLSMKILSTGANGFVGRALCAELARRECFVRGVVRETSRASGLRCELVYVGHIGPATDWSEALEGVEVVVHLAARVHVMQEVIADPLNEFRLVNVGGTLNLARQAAAAGVRRFVFLSSIKVNGEATQLGSPFNADDEPLPKDSYSISKLEAEQCLRDIARQTCMEVVIIRPPLVYGPGVKANFAVMIRLLKRGVPLPLGVIHNKRSLVALDNLVDLLVTCIFHPAAANQIFLVSDGEDVSTTELLLRMGQALGCPARLLAVPVSWLKLAAAMVGKQDVAQRLCGNLQVDISKARKLLGWVPPVSLGEGLRRAMCVNEKNI
jgi:nucleoside-diphosphate-sugar epimerase